MNLALVTLMLAIATGCKADGDRVKQAGNPVATTSGHSTSGAADSTRASEQPIATPLLAGCAAVAEVLRSAASKVADSASIITSPRDTTSTLLSQRSEPACVVTWRDSTSHGGPLDDIYARLEHAGWQQRPNLFSADGPDGSAVAYSRGDIACVIDGSWDGEDDSDSTYVPKPGFAFVVTCLRNRPDRV
jgi:hypothetical protein